MGRWVLVAVWPELRTRHGAEQERVWAASVEAEQSGWEVQRGWARKNPDPGGDGLH